MLEALLYFFWAPLANEHARLFAAEGISSLDKRLPFLYLYGDSNSGKGTLMEMGLRLISGGAVTTPLDADTAGLTSVRNVRKASSSFPLVIDDIEKSRIGQLDPLRNYWAGWDEEKRYPTLIFTSNDRRPKAWFRNRAKMLALGVLFDPSPAAEGEVRRLIETPSPLFGWVAHQLIRRYRGGEVPLTGDVLAPVRDVLFGLYERSGREAPPYLSAEPAEVRHDAGRREWRRLLDDRRARLRANGEVAYVTFDGEMQHWEVGDLGRKLPAEVRARQEGRRLVIRAPGRFEAWVGPPGPRWLGWIRRLFR
jgi:hypothetical protein